MQLVAAITAGSSGFRRPAGTTLMRLLLSLRLRMVMKTLIVLVMMILMRRVNLILVVLLLGRAMRVVKAVYAQSFGRRNNRRLIRFVEI